MGGVPGRLYEINGDSFAEWPSVITDGSFTVELESPTPEPRRYRGRTDWLTDYCRGRVRARGGQVFVFPYALSASETEPPERRFLLVLPAPFGRGLSTEACVRLAEHMGAQLEAAGARLISDPEEIRAIHKPRRGN